MRSPGAWADPFQNSAREAAYRVNVGSTTDYTDTEGNVWHSDRPYDPHGSDGFGYVAGLDGASGIMSGDVLGTCDDPLFASYRQGSIIEYRFDVDTGGYYFVNIKLMEPVYTETVRRMFSIYFNDFNVSAGGNPKGEIVDPYSWSGGRDRAMSIVVPHYAVNSHVLRITFLPVGGGGSVILSAIEVRRVQAGAADNGIPNPYDQQFSNRGSTKPASCACGEGKR